MPPNPTLLFDAQWKLASYIIPDEPDILELLQPLKPQVYIHTHTKHTHTHHARVQPKSTHLQTAGAKRSQREEQSPKRKTQQTVHTGTHTHTHAHTRTHLNVHEWEFFLKAVGKLPPLTVLLVVVVAVSEGGKDTLPPAGQACPCHVQQMQPKLSEKNHNSRVRPRQKLCSFGCITGTTLTCHTTKGRFLRSDLVSSFFFFVFFEVQSAKEVLPQV